MTPKISVITINLNNATGLRRTIESVIEQNYPTIEYIVIDGGSTDGSEDVIKEFSDSIAYWVSEKDKGIYDAMNKAIKISSGDYLNFLNSGDHYNSALSLQKLVENSNNVDIIYGNIKVVDKNTVWTKKYPLKLTFKYFAKDTLPHPASFIKRELFDTIGLYDTSLKVVADWKFFILSIIKHKASYTYLDEELVYFYFDGISSKPEFRVLIDDETEQTLKACFPYKFAFLQIKSFFKSPIKFIKGKKI